MQDTVLLMIGNHPLTLWEAIVLAGGLTFGLWIWMGLTLVRLKRGAFNNMGIFAEQARDMETQMASFLQLQAEVKGKLSTVADIFGSRQAEVSKLLLERLDAMQGRVGQGLDNNTKTTQETLAKLGERLAVIDGAQQRLQSLADEMVSLKDVLSNKQTRGAFGQAQMEAILSDGLPPNAYAFQTTLSNNRRPDAVVYMPNDTRPMVIDAKFPLEGFLEWRKVTDAGERKAMEQKIRSQIHRHLQDIAERYLILGETQDTALMFVPSEGIYADLHDGFPDIIQKGFRLRVMIVSPSLLMLAVQMMRAQMRDARMREQIHLIQGEIGHLLSDVGRLRERTEKMEVHFRKAQEELEGVKISTEKISRRGNRIEAVEMAKSIMAETPEPELAQALPPLFKAAANE